MRVLEIGGSLAGLQFVLDRCGCEVVNVDPGQEHFVGALGVNTETFALLNRRFGTSVVLKRCLLEEANFPGDTFDRIVSVSVLEHVPDEFLWPLLREARRVLKPGGIFVMTIDLFLNVTPFADLAVNEYGRNANVKQLVAESGLQMIHGRPSELHGYPEFDAARILANRGHYLVGEYPAMAQTVVLKKPTA
jgi:SAM-dependent methyltransferase